VASADDITAAEPAPCLACRGTGTLISGKGGEPHDVRCPWCEGTGTRVPGIDAQAHPAEGAGGESADPAAAAEPPVEAPAESATEA
jgi:DnaJ-class molecular chaperone